jgi:hypothetical protein
VIRKGSRAFGAARSVTRGCSDKSVGFRTNRPKLKFISRAVRKSILVSLWANALRVAPAECMCLPTLSTELDSSREASGAPHHAGRRMAALIAWLDWSSVASVNPYPDLHLGSFLTFLFK